MWLLKGVIYGLILSGIFTVLYLRGIIGPPRAGVATGLSVITGSLRVPLYWAVFVLTMATSCLWAWVLHLAFSQRV